MIPNGKQTPEPNGHDPFTLEALLHRKTGTLNDDEKMLLISRHFQQIMLILGLNLNEDGLRRTPERVAKMFVKEIFSGLKPSNKPAITLFDNDYHYNGMLVEKNITVYSYCEHHFVPIIGKAHVGYFPGRKIIGLSKINRLVQYHAKRPQVQERLTQQIASALQEVLDTEDVAVMIDAVHLCVAAGGIGDVNSSTITAHYSGRFEMDAIKQEFLSYLK